MEEKSNKVLIVIPALNEAKTISPVIEGALQYAPVLVVDDGSTDGTEAVAREAGAEVLRLETNHGVDGALAQGFQWAQDHGFDIVTTIDADGQHKTSDLPKIIGPVVEGRADMCHAYRTDYQRPAEKTLREYSRKKHGLEDILCGLKAFRVQIFTDNRELVSQPTLGTALPWAAYKDGARYEEVEISCETREDTPRIGDDVESHRKVMHALDMLKEWDAALDRERGNQPHKEAR